jgi:hypothetical protein
MEGTVERLLDSLLGPDSPSFPSSTHHNSPRARCRLPANCQVFKLKAKGVDGQPLRAYRRIEGRGSSRPQREGSRLALKR